MSSKIIFFALIFFKIKFKTFSWDISGFVEISVKLHDNNFKASSGPTHVSKLMLNMCCMLKNVTNEKSENKIQETEEQKKNVDGLHNVAKFSRKFFIKSFLVSFVSSSLCTRSCNKFRHNMWGKRWNAAQNIPILHQIKLL